MSADIQPRKRDLTSERSHGSGKLRTYPEKWDVSTFQRPTRSENNDHPPKVRSAFEVSARHNLADWQPEAFPEPRTIPTKWDVSGLT